MVHDPFYKRLLGHERIVKDLFEVALAPRLGTARRYRLDFETLERQPTEGVDDDLRRRLQDMVWSVDAVGADGGRQRLHLLIEHQSTVDHAMPLRFLDYGSMLFRRLYDDDRRSRWRTGDRADVVACVVLYNGEREWTAATSLAAGRDSAFDVRYDVVDLLLLAADDSLRGRALWWVARLESVSPVRLPAMVNELGAWLAAERELELTRCLDVRVAQLGAKCGLALPTLARYEEVGVMLEERIDRWQAEIMQRGLEQGIERGLERGIERGIERGVVRGEKALLRRLALRRFGGAAAERLMVVLDDIRDADQLVLAGDWIVDSVDAEDFLARVAGSKLAMPAPQPKPP